MNAMGNGLELTLTRTCSDRRLSRVHLLGNLTLLPDDIIYRICNYLDVTSLVQLTAINQYLRSLLGHFVNFNHSNRALFIALNSKTDFSYESAVWYRKLGLLCSVCFHKHPHQLQAHFLKKVIRTHDSPQALSFYGQFLSIYLRIHTTRMAEHLLKEIYATCEVDKSILLQEPGKFPEQEMIWRQFVRSVFLDCLSVPRNSFHFEDSCANFTAKSALKNQWADRMYWLLGKTTPSKQARMLYILYGPVHKNKLIWDLLCENTAADFDQLKRCFGELGAVFSYLVHVDFHKNFLCRKQAAKCHTMKIFDLMTSQPDEWLVENVACLLYSTGCRFLISFVLYIISKDQFSELVALITSLCLLLVKIKKDVGVLLRLVRVISASLTRDQRVDFLDMLAKSFKYVMTDLYNDQETDRRNRDFLFIMHAQTSFMRALLGELFETGLTGQKKTEQRAY